MTRWRRILLNGATGVSLLLCVVCAVLWARCDLTSASRGDAVILWKQGVSGDYGVQRRVQVWSNVGAVHVDWETREFRWPSGKVDERWQTTAWDVMKVGMDGIVPVAGERDTLGFSHWHRQHTEKRDGTTTTVVDHGCSVPFWAMMLVLAVRPVMWTRWRWRRASDRVAGRCVECGYDLRATPGRCPECGAGAVVSGG